MKTTLDLPDALIRQIKARAALRGRTMRDFFVEAAKDKLAAEVKSARHPPGWRSVFGKAPPGSTRETQALIDAEFARVNPDDWT